MSEYITKDAVFDLLHGQDELILFTRSYKENGSVGERLCNAISAIPAADVEPVVRGEWKDGIDFDEQNVYMCSVCKEPYILESGTPKENKYNFCPNCGAHMERSGSGE